MATTVKTYRTMTRVTRCGLLALLIAAVGGAMAFTVPQGSASPTAGDGVQPAPVEDDMHEFMEYVFEPPYKRLKASLVAAPAERSAWKGIKSDSLILAEAANLLLHRHPAEDAAKWDKHAIAVRQQGSELYQTAKKRDFDQSKRHFAALLKSCNQCHNEFAGGEHQLAP